MDRNTLISSALRFAEESPANCISDDIALTPDCVGMKIYEPPVFGFASAGDEIFARYKLPDVIGENFMAPSEWLSEARSVISFYLPYTEKVRLANALDFSWPSAEWLHGRYDGQLFIKELCLYLHRLLTDAGYACLSPAFDPRLKTGNANNRFSSNWSERHAAYACGLGTFGLTRGIITEKGSCIRFGSLITALELPVDARPYSGVYEYCTMCGACAAHCPAKAISLDGGKDNELCSAFLDRTLEKHRPRYGCGKCQVSVPCSSKIPGRDCHGAVC